MLTRWLVGSLAYRPAACLSKMGLDGFSECMESVCVVGKMYFPGIKPACAMNSSTPYSVHVGDIARKYHKRSQSLVQVSCSTCVVLR